MRPKVIHATAMAELAENYDPLEGYTKETEYSWLFRRITEWALRGERSLTVGVQISRETMAALRAIGFKVRIHTPVRGPHDEEEMQEVMQATTVRW